MVIFFYHSSYPLLALSTWPISEVLENCLLFEGHIALWQTTLSVLAMLLALKCYYFVPLSWEGKERWQRLGPTAAAPSSRGLGPLTAPQNRHLAGVTAEQTGWWGEPEPRVRLVRWHLFSKWFQVICIEMTGINWGSEFLNFTTKVEEGWFSLWVQPAKRSSAHLQGQDQQIRYVTQEGAGEADPRQGSKWLLPAR